MNNPKVKLLPWTIAISLALAVAPAPPARADLLSIFRTDQADTATINPGDFRQIADAMQGKLKLVDIVNFGQLNFMSWPARRKLKEADIVAFKDFPAKVPPATIPGYTSVKFERVATTKIRFTLRVKHINKLLTSLGATTLLPVALEGKPFLLTAPPQIRATYTASGKSPVIITQTMEPDLEVPEGVSLTAVRDALISVPGFPEGLKTQFAGIEDWKHRKLALNSGGAAQETKVNGGPALYIAPEPEDRDGLAPPPQVESFHREMARARAEVGEPEFDPHSQRRMSTLIWREGEVTCLLQGELPLEQARIIAEMMK